MTDYWFNGISSFLARFKFQLKWELLHSQWIYGVNSPADVMRVMQTMSLKPVDGAQYLKKVRCAVTVTETAETIFFEPNTNAEQVMAIWAL